MDQQQTVRVSGIPATVNRAYWPIFAGIDKRIIAIRGGTMAAKSYSVAQHVGYTGSIIPGYRWLVCRKNANWLHDSVYMQIKMVLESWNMLALWQLWKSPLRMVNKFNGNEILFAGLDDPEKIKSIPGLTSCWIEEPSEISQSDFMSTNMRIRAPGSGIRPQVLLTFNPIHEQHWLKSYFWDKPRDDTYLMHTTYRDNAHLGANEMELLDSYRGDPYYEPVYVEGEWGVLGNTVFHDFAFVPLAYEWEHLENLSIGMDFGSVHASAIEIIGYRDGVQYSVDEVHGRWATNEDFIAAATRHYRELKRLDWIKRQPIIADSANPDKITEWRRAGWNVRGAKKGPGTLAMGIDHLQRHPWLIDVNRCPGLMKEVPVFKRREDKDGVATEAFVEINDDGIAACRYATEHLWGHGRPRVNLKKRLT